jgi:hypothetical protein
MTRCLSRRVVPRQRFVIWCSLLLTALIFSGSFFFRANSFGDCKQRQQEQTHHLKRLHQKYHNVTRPLSNRKITVVSSIFYVWCHNDGRPFEFRHYLGMLSAMRHLNVDNVYFYYDREPPIDIMHYNTWLTEISDQYPFLHKVKMSESSDGCVDDGLVAVPNKTFIANVINENGGGIYVREDVILLESAIEFRTVDYVELVDKQNHTVLLSLKTSSNNEPFANSKKRSLEVKLRTVDTISTIQRSREMNGILTYSEESSLSWSSNNNNKNEHLPYLMIASHWIYPKDIWELDNDTGSLLRTLAYGKPDIARSMPSYDELVPNIAHVVWIGGETMDFQFFLTVLSLLNVALVDTVYIHGDIPPYGFYWDLIKHDQRIQVYRYFVSFIS